MRRLSSAYLHVAKVCGTLLIRSMHRHEHLKTDIHPVPTGTGHDTTNDFSINVWCCAAKCRSGEEEDKRYDVNPFGIIHCVKSSEWEDSCHPPDHESVVFGVPSAFGSGNGAGNRTRAYPTDSHGSLSTPLRSLTTTFSRSRVSRRWFMRTQ